MTLKNRLSSLFDDFAKRNDLRLEVDEDNQKAKLEIQLTNNDELVSVSYSFHSSEDGYEYFAALGQINDPDKITDLSSSILSGEPIRGITQRITENGDGVWCES